MMDVVVLLDGKIGRSAELFDLLEDADIEVQAACVFPRLGGRVAHVAVRHEDFDAVEDLLSERLGGVADQRTCIVVPPNYPGGMGEVARRIAAAHIVVSVSYYGQNGELVLATSDGDKTRTVLEL
jgi:hypothetical protein